MMDEQLIDEVAQHGVIYNRQKYYLNGTGSGGGGGGGGGGGSTKYETKDEAWQIIAMKMHSDVETCKKRWKYLRERYVSQRKQGDPPVYEHLSRPYLEKMKFLDQHIQPRKSYRNVPNFLTSPHSATSSGYSEYNMDSKSNGSAKAMNHFVAQHHYHQQQQDQHAMNALSSAAAAASALENAAAVNGHVKLEADQVLRDFVAAVSSQQLQHMSQSQQMQQQHHHHHQQQHQQQHNHHHQSAVNSATSLADSSQGYQEHFRDTSNTLNNNNSCAQNGIDNVTSSPLKSPLSPPIANSGNSSVTQNGLAQQSNTHLGQLGTPNFDDTNNDELDSSVGNNFNMKKPRVQLNSQVANASSSGGGSSSGGLGGLSQQNAANSTNHTPLVGNSHFNDDTDDDSDDNSAMVQQGTNMPTEMQENNYNSAPSTSTAAAVAAIQRNSSNNHHHSHHHHQQQQQNQQQSMFPTNADFLFQLYQQLPHNQAAAAAAAQQQHFNKFQTPQNSAVPTLTPATQHPIQRCSEHLLGELVTTELLKMSKERRKTVQRKILEILFFDD